MRGAIRPTVVLLVWSAVWSAVASAQTPAKPADPKADPDKKEPPKVAVVVESSLATDGGHVRQMAFDGKDDTYFASAKAPTDKDHFTVTFDKPVKVKAIGVTTGKPKGGDELAAGVLEVSTDGKTFDTAAKFADGKASTKAEGKEVKAVRITPTGEPTAALVVREFTLDTDPPLATFLHPVEIVADTTDAPDLKEWTDKAVKVCEKQYPMICDELKAEKFDPPSLIKLRLKKDYDGVAYAAGPNITASVKYFKDHPDDVGALVHETTHCVQAYRGRGNPGWLVEGIADYVRFFRYEAKKPAKLPPERAKHDGSYRTTAAFLAFVVEKHDKEAVRKLNDAMRQGKYKEDLWKDITGSSLEELGREWKESLAK